MPIIKSRQGFAAMDPARVREICSMGGKAAQLKGTAHRWTREEAAAAGRKGGSVARGGRGRAVPELNLSQRSVERGAALDQPTLPQE